MFFELKAVTIADAVAVGGGEVHRQMTVEYSPCACRYRMVQYEIIVHIDRPCKELVVAYVGRVVVRQVMGDVL